MKHSHRAGGSIRGAAAIGPGGSHTTSLRHCLTDNLAYRSPVLSGNAWLLKRKHSNSNRTCLPDFRGSSVVACCKSSSSSSPTAQTEQFVGLEPHLEEIAAEAEQELYSGLVESEDLEEGLELSSTDEEEESTPVEERDSGPVDYLQGDSEVYEPSRESQELESLIAEGGESLSVESVGRIFPYPLDDFQQEALRKLLGGMSVVVCAPTGAGKTAIAEAAAAATLARGLRVVYTTPLKAAETLEGQQAGEAESSTAEGPQAEKESEQGSSDRNDHQDSDIIDLDGPSIDLSTSGSTNTREARLGDVGLIVLDEVHYLGDPHRGSVWEEAIINCPRHIQLLCMSATVQNPDDLGGWISKEHQTCETVSTFFRPVPLHWYYSYTAPPPKGVQLVDLMTKDKEALNPKLATKAALLEEARYMLQRTVGGGRKSKSTAAWEESITPIVAGDKFLQKKMMAKRVPNIESLVQILGKKKLLPVIWFILSRKDCDLATVKAGSGAYSLTSESEQAAIKHEVDLLTEDQPEAIRSKLLPALIKGVASHHAGHLPGWKSLVERLFQRNLLKVVFATGTLAAGINMPARTTVISALGRMTDDGPQLMPHNELLQMAGRAGRRGYDTAGYCVVLQTRFEGAEEAWRIISNGPEPLVSQFNVSYGLVLNLLSIYSLDQARDFCNKKVADLEVQIESLKAEYQASPTAQSQKASGEVKASRNRLRVLREQVNQKRTADAQAMLERTGIPRKVILEIRLSNNKASLRLPSIIVSRAGDELFGLEASLSLQDLESPYYYALSADNRLLRVHVTHVAGVLEGPEGEIDPQDAAKIDAAVQRVRPVEWTNMSPTNFTAQATGGNNSTAVVALQLLSVQADWKMLEVDPELAAQVVAAKESVKQAIAAANSHQKEKEREAKRTRGVTQSKDLLPKIKRLSKQAEKLREGIRAAEENTWRSFTDVVEVLITMGALEAGSLRVLPLGLVARNIQGNNELWLALVLTHQAVFGLTGPELAGLLGAILTGEVLKRPNVNWVAYPASPKIMADSSLDDGDVARLLVRTIDLLKQMTYNSTLLPHLRDAAMEGLRGMDRKPITDPMSVT
ncbi:P-loop containing nucleoside triphosphate hydrolase protein [Dunaliella salina]|uniref:P-loop containing nucleoside triphosphate hydrolase protein n=1 Tax=Dunaliella salina TaxID=3046 RepID=A0ABQ7GQT5_DUNSA|nr:P-loop containing nucleoside triphosphate hydrolase protein [Dunaliella salina]|eukprot:KAF5836973.1 P-loop containing nucleoside triphosphate hydrolase protein [Dunaliella salina]